MKKMLLIGDHPYKHDFINHFRNKYELIEDKDNLLYCDRSIRIKHFYDNYYDYIINFDTLCFNNQLLCNSILPNVRLFNFDLSKLDVKIITLYSYEDSLDNNKDYGYLMDKVNSNNVAVNISNLYTTDLKDNSFINYLCEMYSYVNSLTYSKYYLTSSLSLNLFLEGLLSNINKASNKSKLFISDMVYSDKQILGLLDNKDINLLKDFKADTSFSFGYFINEEYYLEILNKHIDSYFNKADNNSFDYLYFDGNKFIFQPQLLPPIESKFAIFYEDKYVI